MEVGPVECTGISITGLTKENPNPLFSKKISPEEFQKLPRRASFTFNFGGTSAITSAHFEIDEDEIRLVVEEGRKKSIYPDLPEARERKSRVSKEGYYINGLSPRRTEIEKTQIKRISAEELAEIVNSISGDELIFYTGAGISTAGEKPAWNMDQLKENLGLNNGGVGFVKQFRENPGILAAKVRQFANQLFTDTSTPAHEAIAGVIEAKPGTIIFTENTDLKHEAKGSRVSAIHLDLESGAFDKVRKRAIDAKILITVGLSKDDRGIINYLKRERPNLTIVSFTLTERTIPDYLDQNDLVVLGDCQEKLPQVVPGLRKETK
ncbi:MAG: hypothetical protein BWY24_00233 [Microgenomates group bacterium ADurb.Bin219]|nr:MAG: hypothetical protein BWY24_00233 [Microgenomates group bacterium ADurb.Bin219]HNP89058.1 hypothetical protein [Candidatus Woesebacteria bacterium]